MKIASRSRSVGAFVLSTMLLASSGALAISVGDVVGPVEVRDANDHPTPIPELGTKVIVLFYTDPDVKEQNEPFREFLKAKNLDPAKVRGMGVVNMKDTWKPDFAIRRAVREKLKKFPLSLILTDPDHALQKSWNLGDCDDKDLVIIIGKDRKVSFFKAGKLEPPEMEQAFAIIKDLIARAEPRR